MRNFFRALTGKPVELTPEQEAKIARKQAKAQADIAKREAEAREGMADAAKYMPGGIYSDQPAARTGGPGGAPATVPELPTGPLDLKGMLKDSWEQAKDSFGEMFDDRRDVLDPGEGKDMNRPPEELTDPAERERTSAAERAARDAARAPYLANAAAPLTFTRIPTIGAQQLEDVTAALRQADPAGVYGVYRVPLRFDLRRGKETKTYLEWEIAHRPGALGTPQANDGVTILGFPRDAHWVQRANGEPSVVDEDVSGTFCARALVRPEDTFGLTRLMHVRAEEFADSRSWKAEIEGGLLLARSTGDTLNDAHRRMMAEAPLALARPRPPLPFHLEILDWEAVAAWNSPHRYGPARVPAPLPHLPTTPHELLTSYLEIVGVASADSYGVQITRTTESLVGDLSLASAKLNFGKHQEFPSADGTPRVRLDAAEHVVIAYRDRADYQAGRERWRAYQRDVLRARLDHLSDERPPLAANANPPESFASEVFDSFFNPLNPTTDFPRLFNRNEKPSLGPYCGRLDEWNSR